MSEPISGSISELISVYVDELAKLAGMPEKNGSRSRGTTRSQLRSPSTAPPYRAPRRWTPRP